MKSYLLLILCLISVQAFSQKDTKTENVFIITLDGLRWQELFTGADSLLIDDSGYVEDPENLVERFWNDDPIERRKMLMPFFWNTIATEGQLYGNRKYGNKVNLTNGMWFSYPGYNEILCGFADDERINSNDKIPNPNKTVLEFLNQQPKLQGKVAAFGSWDLFPYIINEERSKVPVNAGFDKAEGADLTPKEQLLNEMITQIRGPWGSVRLDPFTHHYAFEYIKKNNPKVVYISYGETDDFAHDNKYDQYLLATWQTDRFIKELWDYVQSKEQYKGKTTFILATDHGRGVSPKKEWKSHGTKIKHSDETWMAVIGPDSKALGEIKSEGQCYTNQLAKTAAALLGLDYTNEKEVGKVIEPMIK